MTTEAESISAASTISEDVNFHEVVARSPDGVVITDQCGVIQYVNEAATGLFGRSAVSLIGRDFGYPIVSGNTTEIDILKQGSPAIVVEMRVVEIYWQGEKVLLATLRDISERIRLTRELSRSNKDLEDFAHVISHDIKAPLRTLHLLGTWLREDHSAELSQEARDDLYLMHKTTTRMQRMIDDLLDYSKASSSAKKFVPVNLSEACQSALDNLSEDVFRTNADVTIEPLPTVSGDESQLMQLFQNLMSNALKYCNRQPVVRVSAVRENYFWHLKVTDNGIGVQEKFLKSVFTPFSHLNSQDDYEGSGIGLATCQKIVDRHQGKIWLESEFGVGSTIHIMLPAGFDSVT